MISAGQILLDGKHPGDEVLSFVITCTRDTIGEDGVAIKGERKCTIEYSVTGEEEPRYVTSGLEAISFES